MVVFSPREVVLSVCEPRGYYGKEAHVKLNQLAKAIHENILNVCADHSRTDLLVKFYDLFDRACYTMLEGSYWTGADVAVVRAIEKAPSIYRYLLEASLYSGGGSEKRAARDDLISALTEAAELFLRICVHSDYFFYSGFMGGFVVSSKGDIGFIVDEKISNISKALYDEIRVRRTSIKFEEFQKRFDKDFGASYEVLAEPYDKAFKNTYGVKLSTLAKIMEYMTFKIAKTLTGAVKVSHTVSIKKLRKGLNLDKKKARKGLRLFEISEDILSEDWQYYRFYDVPTSVSRRPVIRLSGKIGGKGILLFGPNAFLRAFALQFTDIQRGVVKLKTPTEFSSEDRGRIFEKNVMDELSREGFRVLRITDSPPEVGEIDAVAVREDKGVLLIIETKSPKIDLSQRKIRWQLERAEKWCKKLHKKVQWIKENLELMAKRLQFDEAKIHYITGIIVTQVPWYHGQDIPFKIATIEQFRLSLLEFAQ